MADIQKITDVPLFTNELNQNDKKLIVLSPLSLPFDNNPTKGSHNLVDSNTIYNLSGTLNTNIKNADNILSDKLQTLILNVVPIGTVIAFAANKAPSGYIICNGAEVRRTTYAKLFAAIGTTYGAGDGSTTFKIPNLINKFIMGNETAGTVIEAGLPNITGNFFSVYRSDYYTYSGAFQSYRAYTNGMRYRSTSTRTSPATFDASRSNSIYGKSTTVQPPAVTMRFYIKYK